LEHAGNYTCHALRNEDVVQTHMLTIYSKFFKQNNVNYKDFGSDKFWSYLENEKFVIYRLYNW